jgi:hypothetical protein
MSRLSSLLFVFLCVLDVIGVKRSGFELNNEVLGGEIPDLDALLSSEYEPVLLGGKEHAVNGAVNFSLT